MWSYIQKNVAWWGFPWKANYFSTVSHLLEQFFRRFGGLAWVDCCCAYSWVSISNLLEIAERQYGSRKCEQQAIYYDSSAMSFRRDPHMPTTGIELDVSHIPGADNIIADDLSRWDFSDIIPHDFHQSERIHLSLRQLWHCSPSPTLHPPDSKLLWKLPVNL